MQNAQIKTSPKNRNTYTEAEHYVVVRALKHEILDAQSRGEVVDKKTILAKLADQMPHDAGSIDTRMRECMTVAHWCGYPKVTGYKPCEKSSIQRHHKTAKALAKIMFDLGMLQSPTIPQLPLNPAPIGAVVVQVDFQAKKIVTSAITQRPTGPTVRQSLQDERRGQPAYKRQAYAIHPGCAVTGDVQECDVIASHIKPWAHSTDEERLDPDNCVLLIPNLDKLFDRYDIGFDPQTGKMVMSPVCEGQWNHPLLAGVPRRLLYKPNAQQAKYLESHLAVVRLNTRNEQRAAVKEVTQIMCSAQGEYHG